MIRRICLAIVCLPAVALGAPVTIDSFNEAEVSVIADSTSPTKKIDIVQPVGAVLGGTRNVTLGTLSTSNVAQPTASVAVQGGALEVDSDFNAESFRLEYGTNALNLDVRGVTFEAAFNSYLPENTTTERSACFVVESLASVDWNTSFKCVPIRPSATPFVLSIPASDLAGADPSAADLSSVDRITFSLKAEPGSLSIDSLRLVPEPSSFGVLPILAVIRRRRKGG